MTEKLVEFKNTIVKWDDIQATISRAENFLKEKGVTLEACYRMRDDITATDQLLFSIDLLLDSAMYNYEQIQASGAKGEAFLKAEKAFIEKNTELLCCATTLEEVAQSLNRWRGYRDRIEPLAKKTKEIKDLLEEFTGRTCAEQLEREFPPSP